MKKTNTFLQFYILVLDRVKFDRELFLKEYQKAVLCLNENERNSLDKWVYENSKNK